MKKKTWIIFNQRGSGWFEVSSTHCGRRAMLIEGYRGEILQQREVRKLKQKKKKKNIVVETSSIGAPLFSASQSGAHKLVMYPKHLNPAI